MPNYKYWSNAAKNQLYRYDDATKKYYYAATYDPKLAEDKQSWVDVTKHASYLNKTLGQSDGLFPVWTPAVTTTTPPVDLKKR